jgi:hypothetical protein
MTTRRSDPVFLVGDARSGTTYLANLLIQHKDIGLAPESNFVIRLMKAFGHAPVKNQEALMRALDVIYKESKFQDWKIDRTELVSSLQDRLPMTLADLIRAVMIFYCERHFPGRKVWGMKKGNYVFNVSRLIEFFPKARFINIVRDGRAVFGSKKKAMHSETGEPFETDPAEAAERWVKMIRNFDNLALKYPEGSIEVSYEALVSSPSEVLLTLFRFLEVDPDAEAASQGRGSVDASWVPERYKHLHSNVGKPPQVSRIDAWKTELSADEIRIYERVAGRELRRKGYGLIYGSESDAETLSGKVKGWVKKRLIF